MEVTVYKQSPAAFGDLGGLAVMAAHFTIECAGGEVGRFSRRFRMPPVCIRQR